MSEGEREREGSEPFFDKICFINIWEEERGGRGGGGGRGGEGGGGGRGGGRGGGGGGRGGGGRGGGGVSCCCCMIPRLWDLLLLLQKSFFSLLLTPFHVNQKKKTFNAFLVHRCTHFDNCTRRNGNFPPALSGTFWNRQRSHNLSRIFFLFSPSSSRLPSYAHTF